ncbi:MAG: lipopolysaccharide biosynthesis protein [Bacteroidaceae bacterium]|nr:lipopolysaccharide biosynthesis protein [Bacteroidaceae bacterium]
MAQRISASSNKRLAKNTVLLYMRTLVVMVISIFTSRVILQSLGIEDYGTYNVIGGFVAMFSMLGGTLVTATQRFINVELGKKENGNPNEVFSTAMGIHIALAVIIFIALETFGLWFLNCKMNIPDGRMFAANVVFQCSVLAFLLNIICMPYNAIIIAYERMKAFAYISLYDVMVKLLISYALFLFLSDRLIIYAVLLLALAVSERFIYSIYCRRHFPEESKFHIVRDRRAYIRQTSFAGYTFLGSFASILSNHGVNIVLNIFCGVAVNAARAIAMQVLHAITKFVSDFTVALNPQIVKTYAAGETSKSMELVYRGAKFSYYLMFMSSVPIIFFTPEILNLWLGHYPDHTVVFVRLTLVYGLVTVLSKTLTTEILATGIMRTNAFIIGGLRILILPLAYLFLWMGDEAYSVYYVMIVIDGISIFTRLYILKDITGTKIMEYVKHVLLPVSLVSIVSLVFCYMIWKHIPSAYIILTVLLILAICMVVITVIGISSDERQMVVSGINIILRRKKKI